jgi:DNA modification methylase
VTVNQQKVFGHPAVCPVELPYRTILAYTAAEGIVLDPFGGSGTTLVAAEKSGRTAFLFERRPEYCDAILARWESMTGQKARKD